MAEIGQQCRPRLFIPFGFSVMPAEHRRQEMVG
jgi:hypothetical protein